MKISNTTQMTNNAPLSATPPLENAPSQLKKRYPTAEEKALKKLCLKQLEQDRHHLLMRWPFIGYVMMHMELVPVRDDRLPTACTDGDNIYVDVGFYSRLSKDERLFVLAHEVWHSVLLHFARRQHRELLRFNVAADLEIQFILTDEGMKVPCKLPYEVKWRDLSAETIYEELGDMKAYRQKYLLRANVVASQQEPNSAFSGMKGGFDRHIYQGDKKQPPDSLPPGSGDDAQKTEHNPEGKTQAPAEQEGRKQDTRGKEREFVIDEDYKPRISDDAVDRAQARTTAAVQQVECIHGPDALPKGIKRVLEGVYKSSIPWQETLRQFVTTCYGGSRRWLPPSRRHVWQGIYLPSMRVERLKAVVAMDVSGSTYHILPKFFGELVALMQSFGRFTLDVVQCDDTIRNVEHYTEAQVPPPDKQWEITGCGGTDFRPVFDYYKMREHEQPDLLLFFTDGEGLAPLEPPPYPVMWLLTRDGHKPVTWGSVLSFRY